MLIIAEIVCTGGERYMGTSCTWSKFFCKPESALKTKIYIFFKNGKENSLADRVYNIYNRESY